MQYTFRHRVQKYVSRRISSRHKLLYHVEGVKPNAYGETLLGSILRSRYLSTSKRFKNLVTVYHPTTSPALIRQLHTTHGPIHIAVDPEHVDCVAAQSEVTDHYAVR